MSQSLHIAPAATGRGFSEPRRCGRGSGGTSVASDGELRDLILDTAERLYRGVGHETATLTDIACELAIPRAGIQRLFPSRDAIAAAVARRRFDRSVDRACDVAMRYPSAAARLQGFLATLHELARESRRSEPRLDDLLNVALTARWGAARAYIARVDAAIVAIVARGMQRDEFRRGDPVRDGRAVRMAFARLVHRGLEPASDSAGPSFDRVLELCLAGLRSAR
ncbi:hypothetical protein [Rhodoplanes azumiensis]|uniref:HTH tetR-type domain-containing protein n=1 Tax=Rhodoplanes azumiensis TaxID=1897628 RepID=A0ABW5ANT0_9BRAD